MDGRILEAIRAVLFDFGGVLAEEGFGHGLEALAREQQLQVGDMVRQGMQAVYDSGFVLGRGSEADFWSLLRRRTGLRGDDAQLTRRILAGFMPRQWMLDLAAELKSRGYITGILSDQTDWLDRLDAHVAAARELLALDEPKGRKLDFLTQEFNREANTLCSKAQFSELTRLGLDLKHTIDQMREQVQNVE